MTWVKLDDGMPQHPKILAAGPVAFALDVAGLCYSNRHQLDGVLPAHTLPVVLPGVADPVAVADRLVEVGRWEQIEGGYRIHDIHDYQFTAEQVRELSRKRAGAGAKGGSKSPGEGKTQAADARKPVSRMSKAEVDAASEALPHPHEPYWKQYPKRDGRKTGKAESRQQWLRLTDDERARAMTGVSNYRAAADDPDTFCPVMDSHRWLRKAEFDSWQEPAELDSKQREKRRLRSIGSGGVA